MQSIDYTWYIGYALHEVREMILVPIPAIFIIIIIILIVGGIQGLDDFFP